MHMRSRLLSMKILEFAFVGYPVRDLERARKFYEGVLGLKPATVWREEGSNTGWYEYEIGPHCLAIACSGTDEWKPSNDGPGVALEVEDFDASVTHLKENGVEIFSGPHDFPSCRMMLIRDPDGNSICIHKRKEPNQQPVEETISTNVATNISLG